VERQGKKLYK
jgi:ABC-type multidrug transport system ATPase subunit